MIVKNLVSVGVLVYNEEKYIGDLLNSIISQNYRPMEIFISDNNSTDGTWDIIQYFVNNFDNINAIRHSTNRGSAYNFYYVLEQARGKFFIWAGGHDIWGPNMITACVSVLERDSGIALAFPLVKWLNDKTEFLEKKHSIIDTSSENSPAGRAYKFFMEHDHCSAIYGLHRRTMLLQTMPWPKVIGSDGIALVRIAKLGHIVPVFSTWWGRRVTREESLGDRVQRHITVLGLHGFASRYPQSSSRLVFFKELLFTNGPIKKRIKLVFDGYRKLFGRGGWRIFPKEILPGTYKLLRFYLKYGK